MYNYGLLLLFLTLVHTQAKPGNSLHLSEESARYRHVQERSRRDLTGIFDSIANSMNGFATSMKSMSQSMAKAFNGIFSTSNTDASSNGLSKLQKGVKDGFMFVFVSNGNTTMGVMKGGGGDTIKEQVTTETDKSGEGEHKDVEQKDEAPTGNIPVEETT